jgi:hypothetical protein
VSQSLIPLLHFWPFHCLLLTIFLLWWCPLCHGWRPTSGTNHH